MLLGLKIEFFNIFDLVDQNRAKKIHFSSKNTFSYVKFSLKTIKDGWGRLRTVEDG
jgi:hypothetical protein